MSGKFKLSHFSLFLFTLACAIAAPLYTSDYLLLPHNHQVMIPINNSLLLKSKNGSLQYLKVTAKIQLRATNGTYIDSPFETGNIMVKYWKNQQNTPATQVLAYTYETLSKSTKILTATDPTDQGSFDIEALHKYENEHNFMHLYKNQLSDVLFVLAVYRFPGNNLTYLLGMSKVTDQIKISVSIFKATPAELNCAYCSVKTFCPVNLCECYQETFSDCQVNKKTFVSKIDSNSTINDQLALLPGTISFFQIEPDNATSNASDAYSAKILLQFNQAETNNIQPINTGRIFSLTFTQSKSDLGYMIPNIYNYQSINSPSLTSKITNLQINTHESSPSVHAPSTNSGISLYEQATLRQDQIMSLAVYYLNESSPSSSLLPNTNPAMGPVMDLHLAIEMTLGTQLSPSLETSINLGLIVGMIALGFFLLLVLICVLHFVVSKRFRINSIFSNSESSYRGWLASGRSRIANHSQQVSTLQQITFHFMRHLVFRPLKFIYTPTLQRKCHQNHKNMTSSDQMCSICLQEFTSQSFVKYTYCGHILHSNCVDQWFKKEQSCPLCRQKLQNQDIIQYEDRIMAEVWENGYYQNVLEEEVKVLKRINKEWQENKAKISKQPHECTEESLVDNNLATSKYIENTIQNISTMQDLQKSQMTIIGKNGPQNINKQTNTRQLNAQNVTNNQSQLPQDSPQTINLQHLKWLIPVFQANTKISFKRFIKIYRFYRCIYLYHQINKKFDKDSNLYEPSIVVEQKEAQVHQESDSKFIGANHMALESNLQHESPIDNAVNHDALFATARKPPVREHEQEEGQRYNFEQNTDIYSNFNSEQKLKNSVSFKKTTSNKHGRTAFHLDFQLAQHQLASIIPNTIPQTVNEHQSPTLVMQRNEEPVIFREPTDSSQQSHAIKLAQRGRCVSMREEMDGLERDFADEEEERYDETNDGVRFKEMFMQQEAEDELENQRYRFERCVQDMNPMSPRKLSVHHKPTNRSNQTQSMHLCRKSRLSNKSKCEVKKPSQNDSYNDSKPPQRSSNNN